MNEQLKVLIVDDEKLIRDEIKSLSWDSLNISIIGEASNGREAIRFCQSQTPDIALIDIEMPVMDGITLTKQLHNTIPNLQVIFLTSHKNFEYVKQGIDLNIVNYIIKSLDMEQDLFPAIEKAKENISNLHSLHSRSERLFNDTVRKYTIKALNHEDNILSQIQDFISFPMFAQLIVHTQKAFSQYVYLTITEQLNERPDLHAIYLGQGRYLAFTNSAPPVPLKNMEYTLKNLEEHTLLQQYSIHFCSSEILSLSNLAEYISILDSFPLLECALFYTNESAILSKDFLFRTRTSNFEHELLAGLLKDFTLSHNSDKLKAACMEHLLPANNLKSALISSLYKILSEDEILNQNCVYILLHSESFDFLADAYINFQNNQPLNYRVEIADTISLYFLIYFAQKSFYFSLFMQLV